MRIGTRRSAAISNTGARRSSVAVNFWARGCRRRGLGTRVVAVTRLVALAALVLAVGPAGATPLPLPNLVELPPASLEVQAVGPRDVLRFTSTVENLGTASLVVVSTRATT